MKKITVAIALVLAASILVWLGRDRPGSEKSVSAETSLHREDQSAAVEAPNHNPTEAPMPPAPTAPLRTDVQQLFSVPDYGSAEYRAATLNAGLYAARRPNTHSTYVLMRNEAAIAELVRQLNSNPDGLTTSFEVSPSAIRRCTISEVEFRSPRFTPGSLVPAKYGIEAYCHEPGQEASVLVDTALQGNVAITIRSPFGGLSIYAIDDSGFAVAFQDYPAIQSLSGN